MTALPETHSTAVAVIDIQEKFVPAIAGMPAILPRLNVLLSAAKALDVRVLTTEQYPKGLGRTIPEIASLLPESPAPFEKTAFSCFGCEGFRSELAKGPLKSLAIVGVESHVCVLQTALDALARGVDAYVISDCVASRRDSDRDVAFAFMASQGVRVVSSEIFLFMLMKDATHPGFRAVSKLVR